MSAYACQGLLTGGLMLTIIALLRKAPKVANATKEVLP
jgi:hypothetical protein